MRRNKRLNIIRIGLALTVAAIFPVTAYAKGQPVDEINPAGTPYVTGAPEVQIPYLSHGQGVTSEELGFPVTRSVDDRAFSRANEQPPVQIPYLSHGQGVTSAELGFPASKAPDDRSFSRGDEQQLAPVVRSDGGIEVNTSTISGFGLAALLVAGGMGLAIRHRRKTRLTPA
jgi:hypothetical protein